MGRIAILAQMPVPRRQEIKSKTAEGKMNWSEQEVLVTGGTGSFGKKFVEIMLSEYRPQKLIIFSRDELKQHEMRRQVSIIPASATSSATCATAIGLTARFRRASTSSSTPPRSSRCRPASTTRSRPIKTNVIGAQQRDRRRDRPRRRRGAGAQHRQGRQPGQPLRRHQAVRRKAVRAGQRLRRRRRTRASAACATATSSAAAAA